MRRHILVLLCALALGTPACRSPSAAGPAAPQWVPEGDALGSPYGAPDGAPFAAEADSPPSPAARPVESVAVTPEPSSGGLAAPQIMRNGTSIARPAPAPAATAPVRAAQAARTPTARSGSAAFTFRLQVGDELSMSIWKEKELTTKQRIIPGGTIAPPLLGTVRAAGLTLDELRADLTQRYRMYLKEPVVSVNVEGIYSDRVFVLGEVEDAQAVDLHGPTSVVQSISMAGGFKEEFAEKRTVHLIRRGPGGRPRVYNVNVCAVLSGHIGDPPLQRGDIVFVPAKGVTNWARTVGQALAPISTGLVSAGAIAGTVTLFSGGNN